MGHQAQVVLDQQLPRLLIPFGHLLQIFLLLGGSKRTGKGAALDLPHHDPELTQKLEQ